MENVERGNIKALSNGVKTAFMYNQAQKEMLQKLQEAQAQRISHYHQQVMDARKAMTAGLGGSTDFQDKAKTEDLVKLLVDHELKRMFHENESER